MAHRGRWMIAALSVLALVGTVAVGTRWWLTRPPAHVSVGEAVDRYRDSNASSSSRAEVPTAPAAGVYVYATTGSESVDAMGGDTHVYPSPTTITVRPTACGYDASWTPVEGRSDVTSFRTTGDGWREVGAVNTHEFFHMSQAESFVCDPAAWYVPPTGTATWTSTCRSLDRTSRRTSTAVGNEAISVEGTVATALHLHYEEVVSGASTGTSVSDLWLDPTTGLTLRQISHASTANDTVIGHVTFEETITLDLQSSTPQT